MTLSIDHIVISVNNLEQAIETHRTAGFTVLRGGEHANGATHNALICFADGVYLELLAGTGKAPKPDPIDFSGMLRADDGSIGGLALLSHDIAADVARLRQMGTPVNAIVDGQRLRPDGTLLQWRLALISDGFLPFLIQDVTPRPLRVPDDETGTTHPNGVTGVGDLLIRGNIKLPPSWMF